MPDEPNTSATPDLPGPPDVRQSICHTLLAAAFLLINTQNPFAGSQLESSIHALVTTALVMAVVLSWYLFSKRLKAWRKIPPDVRTRITLTPSALRQRAISHLMMSLLSLTLTSMGYLGFLAATDGREPDLGELALTLADGLVGTIAVAVLARTVRDLIASRRASI